VEVFQKHVIGCFSSPSDNLHFLSFGSGFSAFLLVDLFSFLGSLFFFSCFSSIFSLQFFYSRAGILEGGVTCRWLEASKKRRNGKKKRESKGNALIAICIG